MGAYLLIFKRLNFMVTILTIVLAVVVAANVWLMISAAKREKQRRKNYHERMDEFDKQLGDVMNQLGLAKQRLNETKSANAALKKSYEETVAAYEKVLNEWGKQNPVGGGEAGVVTTPTEPVDKPDTPLRPKQTTRSRKRTKK